MADATDTKPATDDKARLTPDEVITKQRNFQVMVVSGIIVVLAILVAITNLTRTPETAIVSLPLVGGTFDEFAFERGDVATIEVWKGADEGQLKISRDGDRWRVDSRYGIRADSIEISSLLTSLYDSTRLNIPSSTRTDQYILYRLEDAEAANLRLKDAQGNTLLHLLVGRNEGGTRAFVRFAGQDTEDGAEDGVFEVRGASGAFDNLYSRLLLKSDGSPDTRRWLDLSGFQPIPYLAVTQRMHLRDGTREIEVRRKPGSDPGAELWDVHKPRRSDANGTNVRAVIDLLMNSRAVDVAGRIHPEGPELGLGAPTREIAIDYDEEGVEGRTVITFGKREGNRIAVHLKRNNEGEFVYWMQDHALELIFKPTSDFMKQARVGVPPEDVTPESMTVQNGDRVLRIERSGTQWLIKEPFEGRAWSIPVENLIQGLKQLQGPEQDAGELDLFELGVGPGLSERSIHVVWRPGHQDETPDPTESPEVPSAENDNGSIEEEGETPGETPEPPEEQPEQPEAPPTPPDLRTRATLYLGAVVDGELPILRRIEGQPDRVFWVRASQLDPLFKRPRDYQQQRSLDLISSLHDPEEYEIHTADMHFTLRRDSTEAWQLHEGEDEPVAADAEEVRNLKSTLQFLEGVLEPDAADFNHLRESLRFVRITLDIEQPRNAVVAYFGESADGFTPVLVVRGETERAFQINDARLRPVFPERDSLLKLEPFDVTVRQILIGWHGHNPRVIPRDRGRTEQQARDLVEEILQRARDGEDFVALQEAYNDDSGNLTGTYRVSDQSTDMISEFRRLGGRLGPGEVGAVESVFGIHILKRID